MIAPRGYTIPAREGRLTLTLGYGMANTVPQAATMRVPSWLWGGRPDRFFVDAGLHARVIDEGQEMWTVRTDERHRSVRPGLVEVHHLAGPRQRQPLFDRLDVFAGPPLRGPISEREQQVMAERTERAVTTKDLVDAFSVYTLQTVLVEKAQLPEIAEHVYSELGQFRMAGDASSQPFAHAGVHAIRRRPELGYRVKMPGVLIRLEHDNRLAGGDKRAIQAALQAGELAFASAEHLLNGAATLHVYLGPLLGATSPAMWCLWAMREFGVVLYSLGRPIAGWKGDPTELLQMLPVRGATESVPIPTVSAASCSEAVEWWGARLDDLFGVLTDPAIFTDQDGNYVPAKHIQGITTAEQLFERVTSLQSSHRDLTARRVLFFSVLDTLERLTARNIETHCSLEFATTTLERIRTTMPAQAAELLLPGAERGVAALRAVQDGFYLLRQSGAPEVDVIDDGNVVKRLSSERAAAAYIKMLRDATHGFGSNRAGRVPYTNTLLAHHTGKLPHDLAFLGYLYLLDLLTQPDIVRGALYRAGRL